MQLLMISLKLDGSNMHVHVVCVGYPTVCTPGFVYTVSLLLTCTCVCMCTEPQEVTLGSVYTITLPFSSVRDSYVFSSFSLCLHENGAMPQIT